MKAAIVYDKNNTIVGRYNPSNQIESDILLTNYKGEDYNCVSFDVEKDLTVNDYIITDSGEAIKGDIDYEQVNSRRASLFIIKNRQLLEILLNEINELRMALSLPTRGKNNIQDYLKQYK